MDAPLPLAPDPRDRGLPLRLPGGVVLRESHDEAIDAMLAEMFFHARACINTFGDFHLAISVTPAAEGALRRLMYDLAYREFPWSRTQVWVVDDVLAPRLDAARRSQSIFETIVTPSDLPAEQFHPMPSREAFDDAGAAAEAYAAELREVLGWREKGHDRLDYVFLPFAPSGGIAGMRGRPSLEADRLVEAVEGEGGEAVLTLSVPFINASRLIAVYAPGDASAADLAALDRRRPRPEAMPAAYLKPLAGELRWYVDRAAVGEMQKSEK